MGFSIFTLVSPFPFHFNDEFVLDMIFEKKKQQQKTRAPLKFVELGA